MIKILYTVVLGTDFQPLLIPLLIKQIMKKIIQVFYFLGILLLLDSNQFIQYSRCQTNTSCFLMNRSLHLIKTPTLNNMKFLRNLNSLLILTIMSFLIIKQYHLNNRKIRKKRRKGTSLNKIMVKRNGSIHMYTE